MSKKRVCGKKVSKKTMSNLPQLNGHHSDVEMGVNGADGGSDSSESIEDLTDTRTDQAACSNQGASVAVTRENPVGDSCPDDCIDVDIGDENFNHNSDSDSGEPAPGSSPGSSAPATAIALFRKEWLEELGQHDNNVAELSQANVASGDDADLLVNGINGMIISPKEEKSRDMTEQFSPPPSEVPLPRNSLERGNVSITEMSLCSGAIETGEDANSPQTVRPIVSASPCQSSSMDTSPPHHQATTDKNMRCYSQFVPKKAAADLNESFNATDSCATGCVDFILRLMHNDIRPGTGQGPFKLQFEDIPGSMSFMWKWSYKLSCLEKCTCSSKPAVVNNDDFLLKAVLLGLRIITETTWENLLQKPLKLPETIRRFKMNRLAPSLAHYIAAHSTLGSTGNELVEMAKVFTRGAVSGRFFPTFPMREFTPSLQEWLADWINNGAVPVVTFCKKGVWTNKMVMAIHTNPDAPHGTLLYPPCKHMKSIADLEIELCNEPITNVDMMKVVERAKQQMCPKSQLKLYENKNLASLIDHGREWRKLDVFGQVVKVLKVIERNDDDLQCLHPSLRFVQLPYHTSTGITIFTRTDDLEVTKRLLEHPELKEDPLKEGMGQTSRQYWPTSPPHSRRVDDSEPSTSQHVRQSPACSSGAEMSWQDFLSDTEEYSE